MLYTVIILVQVSYQGQCKIHNNVKFLSNIDFRVGASSASYINCIVVSMVNGHTVCFILSWKNVGKSGLISMTITG